jgi:hypothetical protein
MKRYRLVPLIIVLVVGCGAAGSDAVFVQAFPGRGGPPPAVRQAPGGLPGVQGYEGLYRRVGDEAHFRPCGTETPLQVTGTAEARGLLAERFRWNSIWQNLPLYAVLRGRILTDTVAAGDAAPRIRQRFFMTGVDSLRAWDRDCGGISIR